MNKTIIKSETNKWANIYNERNCPFNLAYIDDEIRANRPDKGAIYLDNTDTLLSHVLGFTGTNNFNDEDCYMILRELFEMSSSYIGKNTLDKLTNAMVDLLFFRENYVSDTIKHRAYLLYEKYINTILCLFDEKGLVSYGTYLQHCWISPKGIWIVGNRDLCERRIKEIESNGNV
jgi:hypothetical protein